MKRYVFTLNKKSVPMSLTGRTFAVLNERQGSVCADFPWVSLFFKSQLGV